MMPRRIEFHETLDLDGVTRDQAENAILITPAGGGQCAFFAGDAVAYGTWASKDEYDLMHSPSQEWLDFLCDEMARLTPNQGNETMTTFTVICTNPAKSAAIEACEFDSAEWTQEEALAQFATDYNLDASEVAIEE